MFQFSYRKENLMKKRKKNECKFSNLSREVIMLSYFIYLANCRSLFFFNYFIRLVFFQLVYVMVANLVRQNLAVLKISEKSQEHSRDGVLC